MPLYLLLIILWAFCHLASDIVLKFTSFQMFPALSLVDAAIANYPYNESMTSAELCMHGIEKHTACAALIAYYTSHKKVFNENKRM